MSTEEGPRLKIYFGLLSFGYKLLQLSMRLFFTLIIIMMPKTAFNFIKDNEGFELFMEKTQVGV